MLNPGGIVLGGVNEDPDNVCQVTVGPFTGDHPPGGGGGAFQTWSRVSVNCWFGAREVNVCEAETWLFR